MDGLKSIFARNCEVKRVPKEDALDFMNRCHRLGACKYRYAYGLYIKRSSGSAEEKLPAGTMVAAATFSNSRKMHSGARSYEWIRYASLPGIRVTGGMGKLLDAFVEEIHPDDVVSYCDVNSVDGGGAYRELGFRQIGLVERPNFTCLKFRKEF